MPVRLVLGWSASAWTLVEYDRRTTGRLHVLTADAELATALLEEGIDVIRAPPDDEEVLRGLERPDAVLVADRQSGRNVEIAKAARQVFPETQLIVYTGVGSTPPERETLAELADRIIDHGREVSDEVVNIATSAAAVRAHRVRRILSGIDSRLCVFMHDNPDPDALASAVALVRIAERHGLSAKGYYYGEVAHQSNRAFVNVLDLPVEGLSAGEPLPECGGVGLVDHSLPSVNDSLPAGLVPDLIFDHHTPNGPVEGRYVDLRESVGATSSIMVEYLRQLELEIEESLATALLYGIRTDTNDFARQVAPVDFAAAGYLWPRADHDDLDRIANPSLSPDTLGTIGEAIAQREVRGVVLSSCVGEIATPDALAQAADLLLQMDGIDLLLVYGMADGTVHASARARPTRPALDLAAIMRDAFAAIGTAGGHEAMAGAQIPVGMLASTDGEDEDLVEIIREVIDERFFATVADRLGPELAEAVRTHE